ncbi:hypothetical protein [Fibrobacter sp. HC4]|uniref:hypothetical protein n=1 Tax=Fibrobacter sp. HC4 TaxID=3239812 RepID=UPI0020193B77|nr:hypothetical protein [Fibrobacter succinogenes]
MNKKTVASSEVTVAVFFLQSLGKRSLLLILLEPVDELVGGRVVLENAQNRSYIPKKGKMRYDIIFFDVFLINLNAVRGVYA